MDELTDRNDVITEVRAGACAIRILPRAQLWMTFAAAAMSVGDPGENTTIAAKAADRMCDEYLKRFPPVLEDSAVSEARRTSDDALTAANETAASSTLNPLSLRSPTNEVRETVE